MCLEVGDNHRRPQWRCPEGCSIGFLAAELAFDIFEDELEAAKEALHEDMVLHFGFEEVAGYAIGQLNEPEKLEDIVLVLFIFSAEELEGEELAELVLIAKDESVAVVDEHPRVEQVASPVQVGVVIELHDFALSQLRVLVGVVNLSHEPCVLLPVDLLQEHLVEYLFRQHPIRLKVYLRLRLQVEQGQVGSQ